MVEANPNPKQRSGATSRYASAPPPPPKPWTKGGFAAATLLLSASIISVVNLLTVKILAASFPPPESVSSPTFASPSVSVPVSPITINLERLPTQSKVDEKLFRKKNSKDGMEEPLTEDGHPILKKSDFIMSGGGDSSPVVLEKYKLLFITVPKVSCTTFKMLFRRMYGFQDWKEVDGGQELHHPQQNGLKYLRDYPLEQAQEMMTSPSWTRAIFVREPIERMLSAYFDKAVNTKHYETVCCRDHENATACAADAASSMSNFVQGASRCYDKHWAPQFLKVDLKFWSYIDFVGRFSHLFEDTKTLLQDVVGQGTWEEFGAHGWGKWGNESIYQGVKKSKHATNAGDKMMYYMGNDTLIQEVYDLYKEDYEFFFMS